MQITFAECGDTYLAHLKDGEMHKVWLDSLQVLLYEEDGGWFAQGLQLDHFAQGKTEDEVKKNFTNSLRLTIEEHLKEYQTLQHVMQVADNKVWQEFNDLKATKNMQVTSVCHMKIEDGVQLRDLARRLPSTIAFVKPEEELATQS